MRTATAFPSILVAALALAEVSAAAQQKPAPPRPAATPQRPPATAKPAPPVAKPAAPAPLPQDVVVRMQYTAGDKSTATTVSAKANRQRIEYGGELTLITQCETGTLVQINETSRRFFVSPAPSDAAGAKKGGVISVTSTVVDTGERKQLFGLTARRLTTTVTREPGAGACDKKKERVETDGWFIERPAALACAASDRRPASQTTGDCADDVKFTETGAASGYPLEYTVTTTVDGGKPSTMTMTATSFERVDLPDATFSAPAGYVEVKSLAELSSEATAGGRKVGVMSLSNRTKDAVSLDVLSEALVVSLKDAGVNATRLDAASPAAAVNEARAKSVDLLLITQVTDISRPARGLLGRVGGSKEYGAKVDYVLTAPGAPTARLSASERSGTSTLQSAVSTARTVARFVTPFGLFSSQFKFMNTFSELTGGAPSSTMSQSPDPVINTIFSLIGTPAKSASPDESPQSEDAAVAMALEKEVAAVVTELSKR